MSIRSCLSWLLLAVLMPATAVERIEAGTPVDEIPAHVEFTLASAVLGERRRINVYLPPDYVATRVRYPVLYMPDGGVSEDFPHVAGTIDAALRAGQMRPLVLVGIENTGRRRDLTGPTTVESDRRIAPRVGGSAAFRAFLRDELMPEVARRYRVGDDTAIIGESLAGLFVVETFVLEPGLFRTSIALSPSLWWNRGALVDAASARLAAQPERQAMLYFASANEDDIITGSVRLAAVLRVQAPPGVRWTYEPHPELRHDTIYRALAPPVLRRLFALQPVPR